MPDDRAGSLSMLYNGVLGRLVAVGMSIANRTLPALTDANRAYWTGGADGALLVQRCASCRRWIHPPVDGACDRCGGALAPEPVSGLGTIFTFTENHQQFHPDVAPPYVIAIVVLDEQDDLRVVTNIVNADVDDLACGVAVRVLFEEHGDVFVPLFEPVQP
jgi:uncharacterized protein